MNFYHGSHNDVCGSALDRSIDGSSQSVCLLTRGCLLRRLALEKVLSEVSFAAQKSFGDVLGFCNFMLLILPELYFWSILIPQTYGVSSFFLRAIPVFHESVDGLAIGNREIHDFCLFSFVGEHVFE